MNSQHREIDPAIEALLADIAGDPGSSLLKMLATQARASLFDPNPSVDRNGVLLTKAEQHLMQAYREDVAVLLRRASLMDVYEDPGTKRFLHRGVTVDEDLHISSRQEWNAQARERLRTCPANADSSHGLELLSKCVQSSRAARPSATKLALASLRLVPSAEARICLALDLWRRKKLDSAAQVLCLVIAHSPSDLLTSIAWENLGGVYFSMAHYARAREAYANAAAAHAHRAEPIMCWFLLALGLGRKKEALKAAAALDELIESEHRSVRWFTTTQPDAWSSRSWKPHAEATRNLRDVEKNLGPAARSVAHVLA